MIFKIIIMRKETSREALLDAYNRVMVRRAQAALLLKARGYNLSDPSLLVG